jgi:hypothetical protein
LILDQTVVTEAGRLDDINDVIHDGWANPDLVVFDQGKGEHRAGGRSEACS